MPTSKTGIGGKSRSALLELLLTTFLALLLLLVGGAWSSACATGPALWFASPQQQPGPPGAVGGFIEVRPKWLTIGGVVKTVKVEEDAEPLANTSGLAFQPNGALWVCTLNNTLLKFGVGQLLNLAAVPQPAPRVTITSTAFKFNIGSYSILTLTSGSSMRRVTACMSLPTLSWSRLPPRVLHRKASLLQ